MVTVKFSDLLDAVEFASFGGPDENRAFVDLDTGSIHFLSDETELDEEVPADLDTSDRYLGVPHKNDLGLNRKLAISFVEQYLPTEYDRVVGYFHKRGAYGRFKDLLERRDVLEAWYAFEKNATESALEQWCEEHEIQLSFAQSTA